MASTPAKKAVAGGKSASRLIDQRIRELGDWRGDALARMRKLIHQAEPDVTETCKWVKPSTPLGVPVWEHDGIICTGESYAQYSKLTFAQGASLADPSRIFNASLEGGTRRAIDIREGEKVDASRPRRGVCGHHHLPRRGRGKRRSGRRAGWRHGPIGRPRGRVHRCARRR